MDIFAKIFRNLKRVKRGHHLHATIDRYVGLPLRVTKTRTSFQVRKNSVNHRTLPALLPEKIGYLPPPSFPIPQPRGQSPITSTSVLSTLVHLEEGVPELMAPPHLYLYDSSYNLKYEVCVQLWY